jgi:hypothetical protein
MNAKKYPMLISPFFLQTTHIGQLEWRKSHSSLEEVDKGSHSRVV